MKLTISVLGATLELEVANEKEAIKRLAFYQSLPAVCPVCGGASRFSFREPEGYEYYGLVCEGGHEYKFGQHKEGGSLFPKGQWTRYDGEKDVVVWPVGEKLVVDPPATNKQQHDGEQLRIARKVMNDLGMSLYNGKWGEVKANNVARVSDGRTMSEAELTLDEINKLNTGLRKLAADKGKKVTA